MVNRTSDGVVRRHDVLLLSPDPLTAALLGAAVELAGHVPHFPRATEAPRAALRRVRARAVLIDCDHEACADAFIGPARMMGARVQLIRARRSSRDATDLGQRLDVPVVELPMDPEALIDLLRDLPATAP